MNTNNSDNKYLEIKDKLFESIVNDEFHDVYTNSIKSGINNFSLYQKYMNNVIDPKWIEAIEECIIPIDNIIRNPMRFIKQEEEIVPIEQAKKVSQESIRHLAQHTNMISRVENDGSVTPNKILNIHKEETFATYENRFLYTLLKHVQYFIDKRLKLLNDSKINTESRIEYESEFKVGKEKLKIEFKLSSTEKTEKNAKLFKLDDDTSQMDLFQRIERLRMILYDFQNSQLIKSLEGCLLVRPPIMRTNVILKNQNFKKVMELWTFIETYSDAGLTIQVIENEEMPSAEYVEDVLNMTLLNYHIFNHHVKPNKNLEAKKPTVKEFKPNFVRRTIEEYTEEFDIDIDVIEKIFIDQVKKATQKRRENELKVKKAIERAIDKEKLNKKKELEAERKRIEKEKLLAKKAKEKAIEEAKKAKALAKEIERRAKEEEKLRIKNNVKECYETIISLINKKYIDDVELTIARNKNNFRVTRNNNLIITAQFKESEYKLSFLGRKDFFDYIDEKYKNTIYIDEESTNENQFILNSYGNVEPRDIKSLVSHSIKYFIECEIETERLEFERLERLKPKVLSEERIKEDIKDIREYITKSYSDVTIIDENENNFKAYKNKKLMVIGQITSVDYRMTFQRKQAEMNKLLKKYTGLIRRARNPKGHQWYYLINNGDIKMKDIFLLIDFSYKYLIEEERKSNSNSKKRKGKQGRQIKL